VQEDSPNEGFGMGSRPAVRDGNVLMIRVGRTLMLPEFSVSSSPPALNPLLCPGNLSPVAVNPATEHLLQICQALVDSLLEDVESRSQARSPIEPERFQ